MAFSCKIILAEHAKLDKTRQVYLQAIIDRKRATIPLGFYLDKDSFDKRKQRMKADHPNASTYDAEILNAISKANGIASKFRLEEKYLTPELFKYAFTNPTEREELITFMVNELELKRPALAHNTYKQHNTVINKLRAFKKRIEFHEINHDMVQKFKNNLIKKGADNKAILVPMKGSTINKLLKILKQYLNDARKKGKKFKDPFDVIKIKTFKSNRVGLSQTELNKLVAYFNSSECLKNHKKLLRYFLFSCYTGVRISDIKVITWNNIHDDLLIFTPQKTKANQSSVTVPLNANDKKYLPEFSPGAIFDTFADAVSNRYIKDIAEHVGIKKTVTYHTSRHTFGSLFAEGGNIVALQKMMGHGDIKTTMGYVHTSAQALVDAKNQRYPESK